MRALCERYPDVEVYTEASELSTLRPGSTAVLVPSVEDAALLNMTRELFSQRALRVVLFCEREVSEALRRGAPDFFDWISLVVECPPQVPPFVVAGIRAAVKARAPGLAWIGEEEAPTETMRVAFKEALQQATTFCDVDLRAPFKVLVDDIRQAEKKWIWARGEHPSLVRRFRWALAEAGRKQRAVLVTPEMLSVSAIQSGLFPVQSEALPIAAARALLRKAGAKAPGRLAAWVHVEQDAVALVAWLLEHEEEQRLEVMARDADDPGAALSAFALERALRQAQSPAEGFAPVPQYRFLWSAGDLRAARRRLPDLPEGASLKHTPGRVALRALELGDENVAAYFAHRASAEQRDDAATLEELRSWGLTSRGPAKANARSLLPVGVLHMSDQHMGRDDPLSRVRELLKLRESVARSEGNPSEVLQIENEMRQLIESSGTEGWSRWRKLLQRKLLRDLPAQGRKPNEP